MKISIYLFTRHFKNSPEKDKKIYIQRISSKNFFQTCGNIHSQGEIATNADGQSNCLQHQSNINGPTANNQWKILYSLVLV